MGKFSKTWNGVGIAAVANAMDTFNQRVMVNVGDIDVAAFSYNPGIASLGSFVGTIKQASNPNGPFTALTGVPTLTSSVFSTGQFSCGGYAWLLFDITAAGSSGVISIDFSGSTN